MTEPLLRVEALERHHAGRLVLRLDDFAIDDGEVVAVLGPNGAGKSTLFRTLLLVEAASAGRIVLRGRVVSPADHAARRRLAGMFQRPHLFAGSVADNVAFAPRAHGADRDAVRSAVRRALDVVGLGALSERRVETLSGGEIQRVALARAIAARPELLLLDEPTANLDAQAKRHFRDDIEGAIRGAAGATLLITHDAADAMALADRIVVLEAGRVVQAGTPTDLLAAPATAFVAAFTGAELLLDGLVEESDGAIVTVRIAGSAVVRAVASAPLAAGMRAHVAYRPEDVMLEPAGTAASGSARNRLPLVVAALTPAAGLVRCRLTGVVEVVGLVTRESAAELGLAPGSAVIASLKATALRAFAAG